jgi:hypothetical protein
MPETFSSATLSIDFFSLLVHPSFLLFHHPSTSCLFFFFYFAQKQLFLLVVPTTTLAISFVSSPRRLGLFYLCIYNTPSKWSSAKKETNVWGFLGVRLGNFSFAGNTKRTNVKV